MDIFSLVHRFSNLINARMQHTFLHTLERLGSLRTRLGFFLIRNQLCHFIIINKSVPSPGALGFL